MPRQPRTLIGTNQEEVGVEPIGQGKKEVVVELEEEDGALIATVGPITLHFAGGMFKLQTVWP